MIQAHGRRKRHGIRKAGAAAAMALAPSDEIPASIRTNNTPYVYDVL